MQYSLSIPASSNTTNYAHVPPRQQLFLLKHFSKCVEIQKKQANILDGKLLHSFSCCESVLLQLNGKFLQKNAKRGQEEFDPSPFICFQNLTDILTANNTPTYSPPTPNSFSPNILAKEDKRELARLENASRISALLSLSLEAKEAELAAEVECLEKLAMGHPISKNVSREEAIAINRKCDSLYNDCTKLSKRISSNDYLKINLQSSSQRMDQQLLSLASLDRKITSAIEDRAKCHLIRDLLTYEGANFHRLTSVVDKIACNVEHYYSLTNALSSRFELDVATKMNNIQIHRPISSSNSAFICTSIEEDIRHLLTKIRIASSATSQEECSETSNPSDVELISSLEREISSLSSKSSITQNLAKDFAEVAKNLSKLLLETVKGLNSDEQFNGESYQATSPLYWKNLSSILKLFPMHLCEKIAKARKEMDEVNLQIIELKTSFQLNDTL